MNQNKIIMDKFSNPKTIKAYHEYESKRDEMDESEIYYQCGGCSFFAPFNSDWGLCCYHKSDHHLETVFEHFTCSHHVDENWESHSFMEIDQLPELVKYRQRQFELLETQYDKLKALAEKQNKDIQLLFLELVDKVLSKYDDET